MGESAFAPGCLRGQTALVTGASRGIGAAVADRLAMMGADVTATATTADGARAITERLAGLGTGRGIVLDVTDYAASEDAVAKIVAESGRLDILVNNAGVTRDTLLMRMKDEDWERVIATDLTAVFHLCRAAVKPMLKARRGRIISMSSVVACSGNAGQVNYSAAKAGLIGFSRSLAREIGSRGITVNCITPGFIDTDMTRALSEEQRQALASQIPLRRLGLPEDVADAAAFLASPAAAYITGAVIPVNGGLYMG